VPDAIDPHMFRTADLRRPLLRGRLTGWVSLSPAYGREYESAREAIADFAAGKDFKYHLPNGVAAYCSIRDFAEGATAMIHFRKLTAPCYYRV
jgi:hypothetical protein